jgi:hypothetical protein
LDSEDIAKRLAFIKYLYTVGENQTKKPEPMCWSAVLTLHDTIELFLQLIAEQLNVNQRLRDIHFMEYWSLTEPKLRELNKPMLTQKIAMERLNKARVDFKHYGNPPSKTSIENDFCSNTKIFLEDNSLSIFNIRFFDTSLIDLVNCEKAKIYLKKAENLVIAGNTEEALLNISASFKYLIYDFKERMEKNGLRSPLNFVKYAEYTGSKTKTDEQISNSIDSLNESIDVLREAVELIGLGIDFKRYSRFRALTPPVILHEKGFYHSKSLFKKENNTAESDVKFCIDFVIESALSLQENNYP